VKTINPVPCNASPPFLLEFRGAVSDVAEYDLSPVYGFVYGEFSGFQGFPDMQQLLLNKIHGALCLADIPPRKINDFCGFQLRFSKPMGWL